MARQEVVDGPPKDAAKPTLVLVPGPLCDYRLWRHQADHLAVRGRADALAPHEEMASLIPDSRLRVIEECGHLTTLERPEEVTNALRDWLAAWEAP